MTVSDSASLHAVTAESSRWSVKSSQGSSKISLPAPVLPEFSTSPSPPPQISESPPSSPLSELSSMEEFDIGELFHKADEEREKRRAGTLDTMNSELGNNVDVEAQIVADSNLSTENSAHTPIAPQSIVPQSRSERENLDPMAIVNANENSHHFFRKRTARQIMPYRFDRQIYEQQLKRRGIQPIRVSLEKRISKAAGGYSEDSQFEPSSTQDGTSESGSVLMSTQASELSSLDENDKGKRFLPKQKGVKRKSSDRNNAAQSDATGATNDRASRGPSQAQLNGIDSAMQAGSITTTYARRRLTSVSHPSADLTRDASASVAARDGSAVDPEETHPLSGNQLYASSTEPSDESSSGSESEDSSNSSDLELERLKRRIRGVLPPSFLTLENATTKKTTPRLLPSQLHRRNDELRKGIARRKIGSSRLHDEKSRNFIGDSSDSDNDIGSRDSSVRPVSQQFQRQSTPRNLYNDSDSDDMEVADHIDRMASRFAKTPRSSQSSVRARRPTKKSRNSSGAWRTSSGNSQKKKQRKKANHRRQQPQRRLPDIGILDAFIASQQDFADSQCSSPPRFLKIAAREAVKRPGFGRSSPSQKLFDFEDSDDNETVSDVLQRWREGTHEAFETASLSFKRREASINPVIENMASEKASAPKRRLPPGVIAVVPPPPGVVQVMGPPLLPFRRHRTLGYEEVESGEYAIRCRRRRQVKIDRVFAGGPNLVPDDELRRHNLLSKASSASTKERKSKKQTLLPPQQRIRRPVDTPTFVNIVDNTGDEFPILSNSQSPKMNGGRGAHRNAHSSQVADRPSYDLNLQPSKQYSISEFNFPVLKFSATFDVFPLQDQTRFKPTTFVGQGGLDNALHMPNMQENRQAMQPMDYYIPERDSVFVWKSVNSTLLSELETGFDMLMVWALSEQHNTGQITDQQFRQAYEFCCFLARYIRFNLVNESYDSVIKFAGVIKRLTVRISDLFTQFHGYATSFSHLSFYMLAFQLLYIYEICAMLKENMDDYSHLSLDREFANVGRLLIQVLLEYCTKDLYQFMRTHRSRLDLQIGHDAYVVEVWVMSINIMDNANKLQSVHIPSFWELLYSLLDCKSLENAFNVDKYEKIWYATFSICPLYQFDTKGVSDVQRSVADWAAVETMMGKLLSVPRQSTTSNEFSSYCRASFSRCLTLSLTWNWPGTKSLATMMYRFFAVRKLENLESETSTGFPDFLLDKDRTLELSMSDTVFHIFLKYLAKLIKDTSERADARKVLPGLVGLVTPLNGRLYPRTMELKVSDLEALENNYSLLLTLFWASPRHLRPPVGHLRDVIILSQAHTQARVLSVKAWYYLTRLQLHNEQDCELWETGEWYADLMRYGLDDYLQLEKVVSGIPSEESKRRRTNLWGYEALLKDSLKYVRLLICAHNLIRTPEQAIEILKCSMCIQIVSISINQED